MTLFQGSKVIHTAKNLFCNVVSICNLVQEFNGLVSNKGQRKLALLLCLHRPGKIALSTGAFLPSFHRYSCTFTACQKSKKHFSARNADMNPRSGQDDALPARPGIVSRKKSSGKKIHRRNIPGETPRQHQASRMHVPSVTWKQSIPSGSSLPILN